MSEALKPCPFCGGTPAIVTRDVEPQGDPWYGRKEETFVLCDCGACLFDGAFHEGFYDAETNAVAAWNKRTDSLAASHQRLKEALERATDALEEAVGYVGSPMWSPSMEADCLAAFTFAREVLRSAP